jgi:hypothetical protein
MDVYNAENRLGKCQIRREAAFAAGVFDRLVNRANQGFETRNREPKIGKERRNTEDSPEREEEAAMPHAPAERGHQSLTLERATTDINQLNVMSQNGR